MHSGQKHICSCNDHCFWLCPWLYFHAISVVNTRDAFGLIVFYWPLVFVVLFNDFTAYENLGCLVSTLVCLVHLLNYVLRVVKLGKQLG